MNRKNKFNLIDEPWIPIVDTGLASLRGIFEIDGIGNNTYSSLGGNPLQKISVLKLLLAIAQAAYTPKDNDDWSILGPRGMAKKCSDYLKKWHDRFWLYGDKPFLQIPKISSAAEQSFSTVLPEFATGNTTVLTESQIQRPFTDAENALNLIFLMGFALGGKKTDNSIVLSPGYHEKSNEKGKPSTGKPGTSLGFSGLMHNFLLGESLLKTIWFNLFTFEDIEKLKIYPDGIGTAPWEKMPDGENCDIAKSLKNSLIGRLIPLSRFCLLNKSGLHYSEGISHLGYKEGIVDPSVSVDFSGKNHRVIWTDPEKRPWRYLTALLSFMSDNSNNNGFQCSQIRFCLPRASAIDNSQVSLWSGGLKVSYNAGEQYASGNDDFVESNIILSDAKHLEFEILSIEMLELNKVATEVYNKTNHFFKTQNMDGKNRAKMASNLFWQLCERKFQKLLNACCVNKKEATSVRKDFSHCAYKAYNTFCPKNTSRQLDAWAKNKPNLFQYLNQ